MNFQFTHTLIRFFVFLLVILKMGTANAVINCKDPEDNSEMLVFQFKQSPPRDFGFSIFDGSFDLSAMNNWSPLGGIPIFASTSTKKTEKEEALCVLNAKRELGDCVEEIENTRATVLALGAVAAFGGTPGVVGGIAGIAYAELRLNGMKKDCSNKFDQQEFDCKFG